MVRDWDKWLIDEEKRMAEEEQQHALKMADASPIFKEALEILQSKDKERAAAFIAKLQKASDEVGRILLERAETDGTLSFFEWEDLRKLGLTRGDIGSILSVYYHAKSDKLPKDAKIAIMTHPGSPIHQNKDIILQKFNVTVLTEEEVLALHEDKDA